MSVPASDQSSVQGYVSRGFEAVRDAFSENFSRRHELGGACCVYHHGNKVVDLWGGVRNKSTGEPWQEDTMVLIWSATKGLAAMTLALAHSRGWLDYEERVCTYWPEFAQQGKEAITVRQLLAHKPACLPLMSRWIKAWSPILIGSRSSSLAKNRPGSPARGKPIMHSRSAFTKASCCGGSIRSIAAWGIFFRTKSPHRWDSRSTSDCPRPFRTRGSRHLRAQARWRGSLVFQSG
jgi:hypothetical protein